MWARIENDTILELTDVDPTGRFHPDLDWMSVPENAKIGMIRQGGGFVNRPPPPPTREQARRGKQGERDTALSTMTHTVDGVGEVQIRPQDFVNFQMAIRLGVDREWVLADNTIGMLTVAQMNECLDAAAVMGAEIWDDYIAELRVL
ncbi:MAG: hypothetical protein IBX56_05385 [Methylomicrobium sp.]|nr:hypothetical protein [Methylomicrobium sp.]